MRCPSSRQACLWACEVWPLSFCCFFSGHEVGLLGSDGSVIAEHW